VLLPLAVALATACPRPEAALAEARRLLDLGRATTAEALACVESARDQAATDRERADALHLSSLVIEDRGDWAEAAARADQALLLVRRERPRDPERLAERLADAASLALRRGERGRYGALVREVDASRPSSARARARRLDLRARYWRDRGDYAKALAYGTSALDAWLAAPDDAAAQIASLNLLGEAEWFRGRFAASREWHLNALDLARSALGDGHPATGTTVANLALSELSLGDFEGALRLQQQALAVTQAARGDDHPETVDRLQNLANLEVENGDYAAAQRRYEEALALTRRRFGDRSDETANLLHNLALLESRMGRPARAVGRLEEARSIWERRGASHPYVARALDQLANAAIALGDWERAANLLLRAARIRAADPTGRAWNLARLASVRQSQRRTAEARELARRAQRLLAGARADQAREVMPTLALLGEVALAQGDGRTARIRFQASLAGFDRSLDAAHPQRARLRARLAASLLRVGDVRGAFAAAEEAERARRGHLRRTVRYLAESQALDLAREPPAGRDLMITIAADAREPRDIAAAFGAVVSARALVLDEMAARADPAARRGDADSRLDVLRSRLAGLLYRESRQPERARRASMEETQAELEALERRSAAAGPQRRPAVDVGAGELAAALPRGAVLVSFVRYRHARGRLDAKPRDRYAAFVLEAGDPAPRLIALGPADAVESAVAAWRAVLADVSFARSEPAEAEERARLAGRRLAERVWDPLEPAVADASLVLVVPDGPLGLVDLAALPDADGRALVDRTAPLHQLSAERDVDRVPAPHAAAERLVVLGGPDYDAGADEPQPGGDGTRAAGRSDPCDPGASMRFPFLPGAAAEGEEVARAWRARDAGGAELLLGRAATEAAFKRAAPHAELLHVATHGFFDDPACTVAGDDGARAAVSPLLRSGLALAGANRRSQPVPGEDDGLLTAAEVAQLDLRGARWVVLSSCGGGVGRVQEGEGVLGLQRAFTAAGASTVVMSLWSVDDEVTRGFMRALYTARARGWSAAECVQDAQRDLRDRLRAERGAAPPALWAPFVAVGDWR
jgi:hypothetical protein